MSRRKIAEPDYVKCFQCQDHNMALTINNNFAFVLCFDCIDTHIHSSSSSSSAAAIEFVIVNKKRSRLLFAQLIDDN